MPPRSDRATRSRVSPDPVETALRGLVLDLKQRHPRGHLPPALSCGRLSGPAVRIVVPPLATVDQALARDLAGALVEQAEESGLALDDEVTWCWLERAGRLHHTAIDALWESGVRHTAAELGRELRFALVTRHGWHDYDREVSRSWQRLRSRPEAA